MTIRNLIQCDAKACETELVTADGEYVKELIDRAHSDGWVTVKRERNLVNICPECAESIPGI